MVRVGGIEEIEFGVADLILTNPVLEVGTIASDETGRLVDNVPNLGRRVDYSNLVVDRFTLRCSVSHGFKSEEDERSG